MSVNTSDHFVRWKYHSFCNTESDTVTSRINVEEIGNALTVTSITEVVSTSKYNATMSVSSGSLFV